MNVSRRIEIRELESEEGDFFDLDDPLVAAAMMPVSTKQMLRGVCAILLVIAATIYFLFE